MANIKNLLVCGDSFMITDDNYPGLHWSEKLGSDISVLNIAMGGASNSMIATQIRQAHTTNIDAIVVGFTTPGRIAIDKNKDQNIQDDIKYSNYLKWTTNCYENSLTRSQRLSLQEVNDFASIDMMYLNDYYVVLSSLYLLDKKNIPFVFSLGGLTLTEELFKKCGIVSELDIFKDNQLSMNLWDFNYNKKSPFFHIDDDEIQTNFANNVLSILKWIN